MDGSFCVKPLKQKQVVSVKRPAPQPHTHTLLPPPILRLCVVVVLLTPPPLRMFPPVPAWPGLVVLFSNLFLSLSQVDGVSYLLQEIYGIENKYNSQESKVRRRVRPAYVTGLFDWLAFVTSLLSSPSPLRILNET